MNNRKNARPTLARHSKWFRTSATFLEDVALPRMRDGRASRHCPVALRADDLWRQALQDQGARHRFDKSVRAAHIDMAGRLVPSSEDLAQQRSVEAAIEVVRAVPRLARRGHHQLEVRFARPHGNEFVAKD